MLLLLMCHGVQDEYQSDVVDFSDDELDNNVVSNYEPAALCALLTYYLCCLEYVSS